MTSRRGLALALASVFAFSLPTVPTLAQTIGPYLYTVAPTQTEQGKWWVNWDTGYGMRAIRPFGEDGVEQRAGVVVGLSRRVSLMAVAGAWLNRESAVRLGSVQAEVLWNALAEGGPAELAVGVGYLREYLGTNVLMARFVAGHAWRKWSLHGNAVLEKPFAEGRDAVDLITSLGTSFRVRSGMRLGVEAIGEDLEGFFEPEEAEGGAKLLVGPVMDLRLGERVRFRLGGGPIFYMTRSEAVSNAPRLLPPGDSGYAIRTSLVYGM